MKKWVLTLPLQSSILLLSKRLRRCNPEKVISYLSELHLEREKGLHHPSLFLLFFGIVGFTRRALRLSNICYVGEDIILPLELVGIDMLANVLLVVV